MIGAVIGDIAGSRFEFENYRAKDFELMNRDCFFTDDTVMSLAICRALLKTKPDRSDLSQLAISSMQEIGRHYPTCGYGERFYHWMFSDDPRPYNSFGNGSAMRVSGCGYVAESLEDARKLAVAVTEVTHNHPEGIKGAEATAVAVYLARTGADMTTIREHIEANYYKIDFTLDEIRPTNAFNETCQDTVPQALAAFFESTSFEDAVRNAVSVGGDSDTLAAITCGIAEAYFGVPSALRAEAETFLDERTLGLLREFEARYPGKQAD